jgi:DNA-binding response OmpR family regulator
MRILLIEDDRMIGQSLVHALGDEGYSVDWVRDGATGEEALRDASTTYVLVLLDWNLPKRAGVDLLRGFRQRGGTTPVFLMTVRDGIEDLVTGLDSGADDYLTKPFDLAELRARIRALIRRRSGPVRRQLSCGAITLDPGRREVQVGGAPVDLTPREFALLLALIERPGVVLSRQQLEEQIYGWNEGVTSNAIEFLIHGLRRKLGADSVQNVRGVGWRMGGDGA